MGGIEALSFDDLIKLIIGLRLRNRDEALEA
jgi:hypothetical protein